LAALRRRFFFVGGEEKVKKNKGFFFEKKNQKTFAPWGRGTLQHRGPKGASFLLRFVYKK
jgi:hypothetical protein